ncbi:hypothetical protein ABOM_008728 [Aspergillus bombycis]|uniref:N,N-dimethylformamidase beta subunit-like C-terminal domain-containing protein n=1 Tax=Aspergillus bombycis TaxID=109264 RepID=A0A1F7ZV90_9EURO|nr:hypothetical protein ABOM_008728 [Aspergillus bombycis]OGM43370.1 hypothetical protein ABOM_008728 [Aspergillus bombycis]
MAASHIIGYADPLVASPGETVSIHVSCHRDQYSSQFVRLGPGQLDHPDAPPEDRRPVESVATAKHFGRPQFSRPGSFATVHWKSDLLIHNGILRVSFWAQPTLPHAGHRQYLFSSLDPDGRSGLAALIDEGTLVLLTGAADGVQTIPLSVRLERWMWYYLLLTWDPVSNSVSADVRSKPDDVGLAPTTQTESQRVKPMELKSSQCLTIASHTSGERVAPKPMSSSSFNGKIDGFRVEVGSQCILDLDFSQDIPTKSLRDRSIHATHGIIVNSPTRAVTSHDWDAHEVDWTRASYGYGAIHFHDDDVDDAEWEKDFELVLPTDLHSGCYGVVISDGDTEDVIPIFVRPDLSRSTNPPVVLIMPTFTYTAYANDRMFDTSRDVHIDIPGSDLVTKGRHLHILEDRPDLGISLYDSHNDGSGAVHSSTKRVVVNMRPDYYHWGFGGPREFPADLWYVGFLDKELGRDNYDIITDHDLSIYGHSLLLRYSVALSCSHPEYPTYSMLDTYDAFLAKGGSFLYLGGNGYYWVTGHQASNPHQIEVRRADQGCRTFNLPPGHWHLASTGEIGGLWRSRGRPPNRLCGLGSDACGMGQGAAYGIVPEVRVNPRLSFLFDSPRLWDPTTTVIGDFGLVQGAASGDEIDRLDYSLGTPQNAIIVATTKLAGGHSDNYGLFNEEILFPMVNTLGTTSDKVRSDLVYFETQAGGAVFAVGSINWVGALAWKNYENNIAEITANALHDFVRRSQERSK